MFKTHIWFTELMALSDEATKEKRLFETHNHDKRMNNFFSPDSKFTSGNVYCHNLPSEKYKVKGHVISVQPLSHALYLKIM